MLLAQEVEPVEVVQVELLHFIVGSLVIVVLIVLGVIAIQAMRSKYKVDKRHGGQLVLGMDYITARYTEALQGGDPATIQEAASAYYAMREALSGEYEPVEPSVYQRSEPPNYQDQTMVHEPPAGAEELDEPRPGAA